MKSLSPENLAEGFAAKAEVTQQGVRALYEAILATEGPAVRAAFGRWKTLFGTTYGYDPARPSAAVERMARFYGIEAGELKPEALLFALHTYYALLVRLLVGQVIGGSEKAAHLEATIAGSQCGPGETPERHASWAALRPGYLSFVSPAGLDFGQRRLESGGGDLSCWCVAAGSARVEQVVRRLAACLAEYDPGTLNDGSGHGADLLKPLYQELFPRPLRHELGEYYTPDWLAGHVLDQVGYSGEPGVRLLDPACGSGTFLVAAIDRIRAASPTQCDQGELCRRILADVVGFDLNPLAVMAARANYVIAIADLLAGAGSELAHERVEIPVYLCDSILDGPRPKGGFFGGFDYVVGNPPWIAWDNLPADYREATKPLWERYGLFSLSGTEGRHGGGKKDLSMLMLCASADRYLKEGGRLGMVITQTLFQSKGAGDGFRRFRLGPDGDRLNVLRVDDMAALRPFPGAANFTSTIVLEKGSRTQYPVPYVKWLPGVDGDFVQRTYRAEPIEPARPGSPWFLRPEGFDADLGRLVGPSDYVAHLGANSGGANGVYWLEILGEADGGVLVRNIAKKSKRSVDLFERVIEPDLLYPLVRWGDVARWRAMPSAYLLLAQDVARRTGIDEGLMRRQYPKTHAYLKLHERLLTGRAAYRRYQGGHAFYSMYNVGSYTVAPIKVVWRRMDRRINAAVLEAADDPILGSRPAIPQETCVLIAAESSVEAHYLCAVLNSSTVGFLVAAHSVQGGKGFGTPSILDFVKLRRFDAAEPLHLELAACSRQAHEIVARGQESMEIEQAVDRLAGQLWGLHEGELEAIRLT